MGHVALYRQFRPADFDEIVEQKHAVAALRQSVISGQIAHAYLFCGTRGTGKTSIAKIFSRAVNCLSPIRGNPCNTCSICLGILNNTIMDVIEMDAASNNSVDNIRRVCDEVMFLPSVAKYKVYIIDEVHMLSGGAFNALLKTLEEPPAHAIFLLATTEPHRIPATIISRCQRYDFRRIPVTSIVEHLTFIADKQHVSIDNDALVTIANLSDGALRDAISLFDQVSNGISRRISRDDVLLITGVVDDAFLYAMADALLTNNASQIVTLAEQLVMDGRDMIRFTLDLAHYFRDLLVICITPDPGSLVQATTDSMAHMQELAGRTSSDTLVYAVTRLSGLVSELKWSPDMRTSFEIALLSFGGNADGAVGATGVVGLVGTAGTAGTVPASGTDRPAGTVAAAGTVRAAAAVGTIGAAGAVAPPVQRSNLTMIHKEFPIAPTDAKRTYMAPPPITAPPQIMPAPPMEEKIAPPRVEDKYMPPPPLEEDFAPPPLEEEYAPPALEEILPLPPMEETFAAPIKDAEASRILPLSELWATLLHKWEDTLFSDYLQLKRANVVEEDHILYAIFPDHMRSYTDNLTQRADYKKISKDIQTVIPGILSVVVQTEAQRSGKTAENDSSDTKATTAKKPEWVEQMLAFTQAADIPVETLDHL